MRWSFSWPGRRRRKAAVVSTEFSTYRPGSWADVAYPPVDEPAVRAIPSGETGSRIRLGFADGTSVDVEESSADSQALRAAVGRLLGD